MHNREERRLSNAPGRKQPFTWEAQPAQTAPRHYHHVDLGRHQVEEPGGGRGTPRPWLGPVVGPRRRGAQQQVHAAAELDLARG